MGQKRFMLHQSTHPGDQSEHKGGSNSPFINLKSIALVIARAQSDVVKLMVIANFSAIFRRTSGKFLKAILNDCFRAAAATMPLLNFKLHFHSVV